MVGMKGREVFTVGIALGLLTILAVGALAGKPGAASHQPADKVAVAGSTVEFLGGDTALDGADAEANVLSGTLRASSPTDLIISVTAECALWTTVATVGGDDESIAEARVTLTALLDGTPVGVIGPDNGAVVFCDRVHRASVSDLDEDGDDARFEHYQATRSANAFNWIALNVGNGIHAIDVLATLETSLSNPDDFLAATEDPLVQAGVGKRTLVVEPTKLANDVTV